MSLETLTAFFGWCTVVNFGVLLLSTIALAVGRDSVAKIHAKMFALEEAALKPIYFQYLAHYKIIALALNLAPYVALKLLASTAT